MFHDLLATQNRALVLQFYKSFDHRRLPEGLALLSPQLLAHMAGMDRPLSQAEFSAMGIEIYNAFPDGRHTFTQVIAHRDTVTTCGFFTGTHLDTFQGIPATGKTVRFAVMHIDRVSHSKIVEHWGQGDSLGLVQQLGVRLVPGPGVLLKLGLRAGNQLKAEVFGRLRAIAQPDYPNQTPNRMQSLSQKANATIAMPKPPSSKSTKARVNLSEDGGDEVKIAGS